MLLICWDLGNCFIVELVAQHIQLSPAAAFTGSGS